MGLTISTLFDKFFNKQAKLLVLGLDAAGKTTILYKLKLGEGSAPYTGIGFSVETIETKAVKIHCWDIGGYEKIRVLWKHYYPDTQGLVYVLDSNDKERIEETKEELQRLLAEEDLRDAALL